MSNLRNFLKYVIIFVIIFLFLWMFGFSHNYGDPLANYGFSYAISKGEIPYLDFNIISTPLFAFYASLGLLLFNNYIVFLLEQTLLITIAVYFLDKLYGKKIYLLLLVTAFFNTCNIIPTYNFCCFFCMIILVYMEKEYSSRDYLIGFFIGLAILSKHTVGLFLLVPSIIFYYNNLKKVIKRLIGMIIPCLIFLIYLIFCGAFFSFINLCILGLLDFSSSNKHVYGTYFYLFIICFIISIFIIIKNKKEISNYYLFFSFLFAVPIFDMTHFSLYFMSFVVMLFPYIKLKSRDILLISSISIPIFVFSFVSWFKYDLTFTTEMNHFEYNLNCKYPYENSLKYSEYINKFDDPIVIGYFSMIYDIVNDKKIDYFDVLLNGNYGYYGVDEMIRRIERMHNQIFVVSMEDYNYKSRYEFSQFSKDIVEHIINNYEKIDSNYVFDVYYKN